MYSLPLSLHAFAEALHNMSLALERSDDVDDETYELSMRRFTVTENNSAIAM